MIQRNPWSRWSSLTPKPALVVGTVLAHINDESRIELPGGSVISARGIGVAIGQKAFVRGDVVEGQAPSLQTVQIEV